MFSKEFYFSNSLDDKANLITPTDLYNKSKGYGFIDEETKKEQEELQIPEINNGFDPWYWYQGVNLTTINSDNNGCYVSPHLEGAIPLCFKVDVKKPGNYLVTITVVADSNEVSDFILFTGRRRFMVRKTLVQGEEFTESYNVNVCDIIPRGKESRYEDLSIDIALLGDGVKLRKITVVENPSPTIFIAGDSTVTDQPGCYPYHPEHCYSGWGQAITAFLNNDVAISNHSHSGLTTESFRSEGHYAIVMDNIKPGDYCMFQFAHNDQKLSHLLANGGYKENLVTYIKEIREKGATPLIVTPICRNTWKGNDGTYNDLLHEYAGVCINLGKEMNVPVVDLHGRSYDFITKLGREPAKSYFYPGDYTHTNDYGAYLMAYFVALELEKFYPYVNLNNYSNWVAPKTIALPTAPEGLTHIAMESQDIVVPFTDIKNSTYKEDINNLAKLGIIPITETLFRPQDLITRVEALSFVVKLYGFFATNVYNDMFTDVIGHEWYAGIVECACSNGIFDMNLTKDKLFEPLKEVTYEEIITFSINGYQSRKGPLNKDKLNITSFPSTSILKREEVAAILSEFKKII